MRHSLRLIEFRNPLRAEILAEGLLSIQIPRCESRFRFRIWDESLSLFLTSSLGDFDILNGNQRYIYIGNKKNGVEGRMKILRWNIEICKSSAIRWKLTECPLPHPTLHIMGKNGWKLSGCINNTGLESFIFPGHFKYETCYRH